MGDIVAFYCILVKKYSFRNPRNMDATIEKTETVYSLTKWHLTKM